MLLITFGTRPEWIKVRPVIDALANRVRLKILFTGQHDLHMIDPSIEKYNVSKLHTAYKYPNRLDQILCSLITGLPDELDGVTSVMVQGDTTSALAIAIAAFHRQIRVIHLEAGLRTFDMKNPYPEEFNRVAITNIADVHLCPTWQEVVNVIEQRRDMSIHTKATGNTVLDNLVGLEPIVQDTVLVTMHRRENIPLMGEWFEQLDRAAQFFNEFNFVFPMHPNPDIRQYQYLLKHVSVIDPIPYDECIEYLRTCAFVITDSGGLQEESSFFSKKCIVCRKVTERKGGLGTFAFLCEKPSQLLDKVAAVTKGSFIVEGSCPYGDGHAAEYISDFLINIQVIR